MSAHPISWDAWYRRAAATAEQTLRAQIEARSPSAVLGPESWSLTAAGAAALRRCPAPPTAARTCVWCGRPIRRGHAITLLGGRPIHHRPCLGQFDAATGDTTDDTGRAR